MKNNLETRSYVAEFVADADSRNIHGLAIPVESMSELLGGEFYEIIRSTAINQELIDRNDVKIYLNHDSSQGTFARSKYGNGTLHLYITERGLEFEFYEAEIVSEYENTARITFCLVDGTEYFIEGASLGGGRILITNINGLTCEFNASLSTIIVKQNDVKGVVSDISAILAYDNINIATMKVSRTSKGDTAYCLIECDGVIPETVVNDLKQVNNVLSVVVVTVFFLKP